MALDRRGEKVFAARPPVRGGASLAEVRWRDRLAAALDHHRASARDAARRMRRQWLTSVMTVLVIAVALSLPALLHVVLDNLRSLAGHVEGQARISLFLKIDVDEAAQRALASRLASEADVAGVDVVTREQALAEFRAQSGYGDLLDSLDDNPLPPVLIVQPATVEGAAALRDRLAGEPRVDIAQLDAAWLQKLAALLAIGERMAQALALAFALAVLLVVVNTIRLAIENRREEILVVKLVGATDAFVRRPFLYSGVWFGLGGGAVAALMVAGMIAWLSAPTATLAGLYGSAFALAGLGMSGSLALILVGGLLGLLGAWVAVSRHLREVEPM